MRTTKEAEINVALLQYVMKCRSAGDDEALAYLGLARQEAETVESLSWGDLEHLSSIHFPVLRENAIDRDLFQRLIHHVQRTRQSQALCDELIARDAPLPMMHRLYGMEASEYAERGRRIGLRRIPGRPHEPTEAEETAICKAFDDLGKPEHDNLTPEDYLQIHRLTSVPLRTLWHVIQHANALRDRSEAPHRKLG